MNDKMKFKVGDWVEVKDKALHSDKTFSGKIVGIENGLYRIDYSHGYGTFTTTASFREDEVKAINE